VSFVLSNFAIHEIAISCFQKTSPLATCPCSHISFDPNVSDSKCKYVYWFEQKYELFLILIFPQKADVTSQLTL
jgi:hypothetical protein